MRTASPVPRGGNCMAVGNGATARATASMSRPMTTTVSAGSSGRSAAMTWRIIACPAISCSTFGRADLRRLPSPAARIMAAKPGGLMDAAPLNFINGNTIESGGKLALLLGFAKPHRAYRKTVKR